MVMVRVRVRVIIGRKRRCNYLNKGDRVKGGVKA
jgi:hypothetical protein